MTLPAPTLNITFRSAEPRDLDCILRMLADDPLGRYSELSKPFDRDMYVRAFQNIASDPNSDMLVVEQAGAVVGCLQLTLIPGLSRGGGWRALIESVRIDSAKRGQGIGTAFLKHALALARAEGAKIVQLTSDTRRTDAHRFYTSLGFSASHTGFKLDL